MKNDNDKPETLENEALLVAVVRVEYDLGLTEGGDEDGVDQERSKALRKEVSDRLHRGRVALALFFATAISPDRPTCYPADWEDRDTPSPDLVIGGTNDWWLKTDEQTGGLYIQARHRSGDYAKSIIAKFKKLAKIYADITGVTIEVHG